MRSLVFIILLVINCVPMLAQQSEYKHYISNNKVLSLAMDNNYLWLGTEGGLVKFNKTTEEFSPLTKADNFAIQGYMGSIIVSVATNNTGKLYATGDGLIYFDGSTWQRYTTENSDLPWNENHYVTFDNNNVWVGSGEYVCKIQNNIWSLYQLLDASILSYFAVNEIVIDSKKVAWVGTSHGLFKIDNEEVTKIDLFNFGQINSLKIDTNDNIWIATNDRGLVIYFPEDNSIMEYNTKNSNIPNNSIRYIHNAENNDFWLVSNKLTLFSNNQFTTCIDKDSVIILKTG